jgi:hypothetical protein
MKKILFALVIALLWLGPSSAQSAWLLWKRSVVTKAVPGAPRNLGAQGTVDKWELLNALELRKECLTALRAEYKKTYDGLVAAYPNEPIDQSALGDGISASVSAGLQTNSGSGVKPTQLSFEYAFWCLPPAIDPRSTTLAVEKK